MAIENLKYNPFSLNTAKAAWENKEQSIPSRTINTVVGALKDIYIKNPYDLTMGNAQYAFSASEQRTRSEKIAATAIIFTSSLYTLMLYGATVNLAGKGMAELGNRTGLQCLSKGGQSAQRISEIVFFAGAIPLYGAFYALPKMGIEQIPQLITLAGEKIQMTAKWVFENLLTPFWTHAVQPVLQTIGHTLDWIKNVIDSTAKIAFQKITTLSNWVFENLLTPFWTRVAQPVLQTIGHTFHWIKNVIGSTAKIAFQKIAEFSTWILENCLQPAWSRVIEPMFDAIQRAVQCTANKTVQLAHWILHNVITPIQDRFIEPLGRILSKAFRVIGTTLDNVIQSVVRRSIECVAWIFNKVLEPSFTKIANAASAVGQALFNYVILPIGKELSVIVKKIAVCANLIFDKAIAPLGRAVRDGCSFTWSLLQQKTHDLFENVASAWAKAASFFDTRPNP